MSLFQGLAARAATSQASPLNYAITPKCQDAKLDFMIDLGFSRKGAALGQGFMYCLPYALSARMLAQNGCLL